MTILCMAIKRMWVFSESLNVQAPDTPVPGGGKVSPHTAHMTYGYVHRGEWVHPVPGWYLRTWVTWGPALDDDEITEDEVTLTGDDAYCYGPGYSGSDDVCGDVPVWIKELAAQRMQMLPVPPQTED